MWEAPEGSAQEGGSVLYAAGEAEREDSDPGLEDRRRAVLLWWIPRWTHCCWRTTSSSSTSLTTISCWKDSKTYPWIVITNDEFPKIYLTRRVDRKNGTYFGPYSSVSHANTSCWEFSSARTILCVPAT